MTLDQVVVFATLLSALVLFVHGGWRYDLVSLAALLVVTMQPTPVPLCRDARVG